MEPRDPTRTTEQRSVLLVDDDPDIRRIIALVLRHAGLEVIETEGRAEAISLAENQMPAAVVVDLHMPEFSALEVVAQLRDTAAGTATPVLFLTEMAPDKEAVARFASHHIRFISNGDPSKIVAALSETWSGSAAALLGRGMTHENLAPLSHYGVV